MLPGEVRGAGEGGVELGEGQRREDIPNIRAVPSTTLVLTLSVLTDSLLITSLFLTRILLCSFYTWENRGSQK